MQADRDVYSKWLASIPRLTVQTYPQLVVKTRLQAKAGTGGEVYNGTLDCIQKIWAKSGFVGFYAGLNSKLFHSVLTAALLFLVKESAVKYTIVSVDAIRKMLFGK